MSNLTFMLVMESLQWIIIVTLVVKSLSKTGEESK